jgi:hypothetical protein
MGDRQPLLNILNQVSFDDDDDVNENNKQYSVNKYDTTNNKFQEKYNEYIILHSLFRWRRWFGRNENDDAEYSNKNTPVSVFQMVSEIKRNIF